MVIAVPAHTRTSDSFTLTERVRCLRLNSPLTPLSFLFFFLSLLFLFSRFSFSRRLTTQEQLPGRRLSSSSISTFFFFFTISLFWFWLVVSVERKV